MDTTQWSGGCLDHSKDSNSSPEGERKGEADRDREGEEKSGGTLAITIIIAYTLNW